MKRARLFWSNMRHAPVGPFHNVHIEPFHRHPQRENPDFFLDDGYTMIISKSSLNLVVNASATSIVAALRSPLPSKPAERSACRLADAIATTPPSSSCTLTSEK